VTTINQSIIDKLFTEHSSSTIYENDVMLDKASYPETIEGCIQVINELRHAQQALHLTITENEYLLECLQSDALRAESELDKEHREWEHRECEYHRGYHEEHRGRDQVVGNRPGSMGDRRRSKSIGSATQEVDSRQYDRRSADQRRGSSCPSYIMNQVFQGVWRDRQERQGRVGEDRHPRTYSRQAPPRRAMTPSLFRGGWGASREGNNNTFRGQTSKSG